MDKKLIIILIFFLICFTNTQKVKATQEELVEEQIKDLQVDTLIQDIEKVTDKNINLNEIFGDAIKGKTSSNIILKGLGKILGTELKESMKMVISILLIIVICGMLRSISENIGNNQTSKVGHFIQIIILITVLMKVYASILKNVKETLETISSFVYMLIPMFMSLSISTRKHYIINRNPINNTNFNKHYNSVHKSNFNSSSNYSNSTWHNFKYFRRSSIKQIIKIYEIHINMAVVYFFNNFYMSINNGK